MTGDPVITVDDIRAHRNLLLAATDYRVLPDVPWDVQPWLDYRQALRDLPELLPVERSTVVDPLTVAWPVPPEAV